MAIMTEKMAKVLRKPSAKIMSADLKLIKKPAMRRNDDMVTSTGLW